MNCYYCELEGGAGGTRYGVRPAVGICLSCGAGLCAKHARRDEPGGPLRCPEPHAHVAREEASNMTA